MECEETRVDMREFNKSEMELTVRNTQLIFRINHTMPFTEEYDALVRELFRDRIGERTSAPAMRGRPGPIFPIRTPARP